MIKSISIFLVLCSTTLSAAIFYPMDTTCPLSCHFSLQQHNRILVENGRIKKVIFPEDKLHVRMEETSGQVFIQARNHLREKTMISIISQGGIVQDIEIEFSDQPSEVVILQENDRVEYSNLQEIPFISSSTAIIEAILHGQIPSGYQSLPITHSSKKISKGLQTKLVGRLQGGDEDLYLYQIRNPSMWRKKRIEERNLSTRDSLWVYVQKRCLQPKETGLAIVSRQR